MSEDASTVAAQLEGAISEQTNVLTTMTSKASVNFETERCSASEPPCRKQRGNIFQSRAPVIACIVWTMRMKAPPPLLQKSRSSLVNRGQKRSPSRKDHSWRNTASSKFPQTKAGLTVPAALTMTVPVTWPKRRPADIVRGMAGMARTCRRARLNEANQPNFWFKGQQVSRLALHRIPKCLHAWMSKCILQGIHFPHPFEGTSVPMSNSS